MEYKNHAGNYLMLHLLHKIILFSVSLSVSVCGLYWKCNLKNLIIYLFWTLFTLNLFYFSCLQNLLYLKTMAQLLRLSKRSFCGSNQTLIHKELSSTITRLEYVRSDTSISSFSNRKSLGGPLKAAILDWSGTTIDAHGMTMIC